MPEQSGALGRAIANLLYQTFGRASFALPVIIAVAGWRHISAGGEPVRRRLDTVWAVLALFFLSSFFSLAGTGFYCTDSMGGWVGSRMNPFFLRLFGLYAGLIAAALLAGAAAGKFLHMSVRRVCLAVWQSLIDDYREWQVARAAVKKEKGLEPVKRSAREGLPESEPRQQELPRIVLPPAPERTSRAESAAKPPKPVPLKKEPVPDLSSVPYTLPPSGLLSPDRGPAKGQSRSEQLAQAELLTKTLADFNIEAAVKEIIPGPVVTRYDIELAPGIKIQSVVALTDNIALAMRSQSIRVVPVPEKSAVGVEVPNEESSIVGLKAILECPDFTQSRSLMTLALGKTTDGMPYVTDLAPMPHLLVAGATGSGKSVGIHSIILSILFRARPDQVKFMLIDPKRVEMPVYRQLPHLYDPRVSAEKADIITQPKIASESLKKLVRVMELRYEKYAKETVRNIEGYNEKMAETGGQKDFYIIVVIDELADLMLAASKEVEDSIQRLAQMARAVGIHLILSTQRPSVNVITGVIKANFPARISFQTTSKVDSRVILDAIGADALLGKGDMLFLPPGESRCIRLQGAFVSTREAEKIVAFIAQQNYPRQYENPFASQGGNAGVAAPEDDRELGELKDALELILERKRVSQDLLKAHFGSSARATNLLSLLETRGFINKPEGTNRWTIYFDKISEFLAGAGPSGGDSPEAPV